MYYNHSSMRKVHLVKGNVVYVCWIDTVYVQHNLQTEFSKGEFCHEMGDYFAIEADTMIDIVRVT